MDNNDNYNYIIKYNNDNDVITETDIYNKIEFYAQNRGIACLDDLKDVRTAVFNQILFDVGRGFFKPLNVFKLYNDNYNRYDINKLNILLDLYIYIAMYYDKMLSINGFLMFAGLGAFYGCDYENRPEITSELKSIRAQWLKKINDADAVRTEERAADSKNPVMNISYANYRHGWNGTIKANEIKSTVKTLTDIRSNLSLSDGLNANNGE